MSIFSYMAPGSRILRGKKRTLESLIGAIRSVGPINGVIKTWGSLRGEPHMHAHQGDFIWVGDVLQFVPSDGEEPPFVEPIFGSPAAHQVLRSREDVGATQNEAAQTMGVALLTWSKWERGITPMSPIKWAYWLERRQQLTESKKSLTSGREAIIAVLEDTKKRPDITRAAANYLDRAIHNLRGRAC